MSAPAAAPSLSDADYERFRAMVRATSGIDVVPSRRPELERVAGQTAQELGLPGSDALYRLLAAEPRNGPLLETLIARLTVGETYFFRNRPQFEALEQHILPALIARRRGERTLRIWSAGCATGEEPYSLSILLHRLLPDLADWHIDILATDINRMALDRARRALYGNWSFRDGATELQPLYFTRRDQLFELAPHIRQLVRFEYLNLADAQYPSLLTGTCAMDLILCRNVLIYFAEENTQQVCARLYEALAPEGWLLVGHAEPSATTFQQFAVRNFPGTVVYQKSLQPATAAVSQYQAQPWLGPPLAALMPLSDAGTIARATPRASAPAQSSGTPGDTNSVAAAERLWEQGKPDEAISLLKARCDAQPADGEAPYLLAKIYADRQMLAEAEAWVERALQRAPLMAESHYLRGLILQESERHWEALEALRGCVYVEPGFVLAHMALAGQFARLGQPQRAQKALDNVFELLAGRPGDELIAGGDGLTVGRLREMAAARRKPADEQR